MIIEKNTECPYAATCRHKRDNECKHKGKDHPVDYTCLWATFQRKHDEEILSRVSYQPSFPEY